jgi:hypothetical protein
MTPIPYLPNTSDYPLQTQTSKQTSKIFWHLGVLKTIDEHKNPSLKERFKNRNHKF